MTICGLTSKCTALKATGLLGCLWMKILSFGMKPKWMQHLRAEEWSQDECNIERGLAQDPSAQSSLYWVERCFCVQNPRASHVLCYDFDNSDSSVSKPIACSNCNGLKDTAVMTHSQRLSMMVRCSSEQASSLLVKDGASGSTSPIMRWEAHLSWMNPGWMSPA